MTGGVKFVIRSSMAERLMERAQGEGIRFISASRTGEREICVWVRPKYEKSLSKLLEKFSIRFEISERRGMIRLFAFFKARFMLFFCGLIALAALLYISGRIWNIEVSGASDGKIRAFLKSEGIKEGVLKGDIDPVGISRMIQVNFEGISFVGVKVSGTHLLIDVHPENKAPDVYRINDARSLYADRDGVVEKVRVVSGQAMVKPGDTVKKGDILILGQEKTTADGGMKPVRAEGSVIARMWTTGTSECLTYETQKIYTGRKSADSKIQTPFFSKMLVRAEKFGSADESVRKMPVGGLFIPVYIVKTEYMEYTERRKMLSVREAQDTLGARALADARRMADGNMYESKNWIDFTVNDETIKAKAIVEWTREIAREEQGG